ncbi:MAG: hypothetical protein AB8G15_12860 [Saprospiraceae bacterium]
MRTLMFSIMLILSMGFTASAHQSTAFHTDPPTTKIKLKDIDSPSKIFFQDEDNTTVFIDFSLVLEPIAEVNIHKAGSLMMEDDVRDLPSDTIYELNLSVIRDGSYILEVVTADGESVFKEIIVE